MRRLRISIKFIPIVAIMALFLALSYVKFYTTQIRFSDDPTVAIVKTEKIQVLKNFHTIDTDSNDLSWYKDNGFHFIYADEMGHIWGKIHSFSIAAWWIIIIGFLPLIMIYNLRKRIKNNSFVKP